MKKIKFLLLTLIMFIPFVVNADNFDMLPEKISTNEGYEFVYSGNGDYYLYVDNSVTLLNLNYDFGANTLVVGSNVIVVDGFSTTQKIMVYFPLEDGVDCTPSTCEPLIVSLNITKQASDDGPVSLKDLEVAGFDINFSNKKTDYVVYVPNWTDSVYVYADHEDSVNVTGTGIIDLEEKGSTKIEVYVHNTSSEKTFTITVKKRNPYIVFYIIIGLLVAGLIGIVIYFMNANKKTIKVGDIKSAFGKLDIKKNEKEEKKEEKKEDVPAYEQPISSENLKSGILTPRNMILPEEDVKEETPTENKEVTK